MGGPTGTNEAQETACYLGGGTRAQLQLSGQLGWRIACVMVLFFESVIVRRAHRKHVVEVEPRVIEIT
jgi:hypothetical protein